MRVLLAIVLLLGCTSLNAKTITCAGCGLIAKRTQAVSAGIGTHFVVNMSDGTIAKWKVEQDCSGSICVLATASLSVDAAVTSYITFYRTNNGKAIPLALSQTYPDSAYEAIRFPQLSSNVHQAIWETGAGLLQDMSNRANFAGSIFGFSYDPVSFTVKVNHQDGSSSLYVYDQVTMQWVRVKGESRDSNGNLIPETAATVTGGPGTTVIYSFSGNQNNLMDFVYQLQVLGVSITGPTSNRTTIVCVSDSQSTVCRADQ